jgi:hypothetical protein
MWIVLVEPYSLRGLKTLQGFAMLELSVTLNGRCGLIDREGKIIVKPQFASIEMVS